MLMSSNILNVVRIISRAFRAEGDRIWLCEQTFLNSYPNPIWKCFFQSRSICTDTSSHQLSSFRVRIVSRAH